VTIVLYSISTKQDYNPPPSSYLQSRIRKNEAIYLLIDTNIVLDHLRPIIG